jgi:hypothetical protein
MLRPSGGRPPAGLSAVLGLTTLWTYFVRFSYYQLVVLFVNMVCLTVGLAFLGTFRVRL